MRTFLSVRVFVATSVALFAMVIVAPTIRSAPAEAPASFRLESNGFAEEFCRKQSTPRLQPLAEVTADSPAIPDGRNDPENECTYATALGEFTGPEDATAGLGPIFNAAGCGECHGTPIIGGSSQVVEKRAGFMRNGLFVDPPGGSLIQDRSHNPAIQELVPNNADVVAFRASLSILGLGFVEAISNTTLENIRDNQPAAVRGRLISVPVFERPGQTRYGRFGWKDQQASLLSFSADAYVNEMGITSPFQRDEPTSNGASVAGDDQVPAGHPADVDDEGVDVALFALFMRSTKAPPVDAGRLSRSGGGSAIFDRIGCATCHTRSITTAAPGTLINGGTLRVADALGDKIIHPFSDFLLHDVGTGDGIVQNGGQATRNMLRTVPLWGLRARGRFMHDAESLTLTGAIQRHRNQADAARIAFFNLRQTDQNQVLAFLMSL
jgi:CxxC motif-containing protein (DUF1111 family)